MTQEEKELVIKELCARLPYSVQICVLFEDYMQICGGFDYDKTLTYDDVKNYCQLPACSKTIVKPYLRPLSSMTVEEKKEYGKVCELDTEILANHPMNGEPFPALYNSQDWLNKKMFDYRGLIPKGLALKAKEGMYNN